MNQQENGVDYPTYMKASHLLFTPQGERSPFTGEDRRTLQSIKHANDAKQLRPNNPYAGPVDKSAEANNVMNSIQKKKGWLYLFMYYEHSK